MAAKRSKDENHQNRLNCRLGTIILHFHLLAQFNDELYRKIHCLTSELFVKFHAKNRYRMNREAMTAISVLQVKFNVEFTWKAVIFS